MTRDLVTLDELPDETLFGLLELGERIDRDRREFADSLRGELMAAIFLEPSTRTRLSFEAAMHRLGGRVITVADPATSSAAKGETLVDSIRVTDQYADLIVLRHPLMGAALVAAEASVAPVLNAGDGGHEHPTQTLCDLLTLRAERGSVKGRLIVVFGDLRYGRTTHSLSRTLVRLGARVLFVAEHGFEPPASLRGRLDLIPGAATRDVLLDQRDAFLGEGFRRVLLAGPASDLPAAGATVRWSDDPPMALYVTRAQRERFLGDETSLPPSLPVIDRSVLTAPCLADTLLMHPLPRVSEINPEVDGDPRAAYFRQVRRGVPARMGLLLWASGAAQFPDPIPEGGVSSGDWVCDNRGCIAADAAQGVAPRALVRPDAEPVCAFCHAPKP